MTSERVGGEPQRESKEIIAEAIGIGPQTKGVEKQYQTLIQKIL